MGGVGVEHVSELPDHVVYRELPDALVVEGDVHTHLLGEVEYRGQRLLLVAPYPPP